MVILNRWECECLKKASWTLLYGRRKTGKTWLLLNCTPWDTYITIAPDASCIEYTRDSSTPRTHDPSSCPRIVGEAATTSKLLIVDELQRAPTSLQEALAHAASQAQGIHLAASGMGAVKRIIGPRSPLLGHFAPWKIEPVHPADAIASLEQVLETPMPVVWAMVARDPWVLKHVSLNQEPWSELARKAWLLTPLARGLLGEVFRDEERALTRAYEALLTLTAEGKWNATHLATHLYSSGLASAPTQAAIGGYLAVLEQAGLLERVRLWKTRRARAYYRHSSPLLAALLSLSQAGDGPERTPLEWLEDRARGVISRETVFDIGKLLGALHGLAPAHTIQPAPYGDIDIVLLDRKGVPKVAYEVKLGRIDSSDAVRLRDRASRLGISKVGLVSLTREPPTARELGVDEALGPQELLRASKHVAKKLRRDCSPEPSVLDGV